MRSTLRWHGVAIFAILIAAMSAHKQSYALIQEADTSPTPPVGQPRPATVAPDTEPITWTGVDSSFRGHPVVGSIRQERANTFGSSIALGSGYDTAVDDLANAAGSIALLEASVAATMERRRYALVFEHDSKVARSFGAGLGVEQFQQSGAWLIMEPSRRTHLSLLFENGYGSDAARAVGSLTADSLMTAIPDRNVVAYGLVSGNTLTDHLEVSVEHLVSRTLLADVNAGAFFRHFFDTNESSQQYDLDIGMQRQITPRAIVGVRAEAVDQEYAVVRCTTGFLAGDVTVQLSRGFRLHGTAGPVVGSSRCTGRYTYDFMLSDTTVRGHRLYVGSSRRSSDGYVLNTSWETTVYGGITAGQPRRLQTRLDSGYASYAMAQTAGSAPLQGYFVSGELHRQLASHSSLALTARYFSRGDGGTQVPRTVVMFTYTWSRRERQVVNNENLGGSDER